MPAKRGRGRPSKLTDKVRDRFVTALKDGHYLETACRLAGIGTSTLSIWMQKGERQKRGEYREFRDAVLTAQAEAEDQALKTWTRQMPENWQACRDYLARRFPERWMSREGRELTGKGGGPVQVSAQDVVQALDELEKWKRERGPAPSPGGPGNPEVP